MMHLFKKPYFTAAVVFAFLFIGTLVVRQGFAWTNPAGAPPFGTPVISSVGGNVGINVAPDANYKLTTGGGGVKGENNSTTQPAGYFNNVGGGPALTVGTGGITLGGVNKTAWPSTLAGTGTANYLAKWTATTTTGNSILFDNGTSIGIGTPLPGAKLDLGTSGFVQTYSSGGTGWGGSTNTAGFRTAWSTGYGASFEAWDGGAPKWGIYKWSANTPSVVMQGQYDSTNVNFTGNIGIGITTPDANYRLTTSGGGIKAENNSATQPASYFSNAGGGPALTIGTGGITLGGVNKTAWPSGAGQWITSGNDIYSANSGDVGVGTSNPTQKLDVIGSVKATAFCIGSSCITDWSASATTTISNGTVSWGYTTPYTGNYKCVMGGYDVCLTAYTTAGVQSTCGASIPDGYARCSKVIANRTVSWGYTTPYSGDFKCIAAGYDTCLDAYTVDGAQSTCGAATPDGYARCSVVATNSSVSWGYVTPYTGNFKCVMGGHDTCLSTYTTAGVQSTCGASIPDGYARCANIPGNHSVSWGYVTPYTGNFKCVMGGYDTCHDAYTAAGIQSTCGAATPDGYARCSSLQ